MNGVSRGLGRLKPSPMIALLLIVGNLFAWARLASTASPPYVVPAVRDAEVASLLDYIRSGEHSGETWTINLTELEAEQTITWYLKRWPQIPFAHPQLEIRPDYLVGEGDVTLAGLRVHVRGKGRITLEDGLPMVEILQLSIPLPRPLREALERELRSQIRRADELPVRFTSAEWGDGEVTVQGFIR
jgi:hypothetical protein